MALHVSKVEDFSSQLVFTGSDVASNIEFTPIEAKSVTSESYEIKSRIRSTNDTLIVTSPTAGEQPKLHTTTSIKDPADNLEPKLKTNTEITNEEKGGTWGKALDDVFTGGTLNGEWGKWDDGKGGGWKGLLSKASKSIIDNITDNSRKDWISSLISQDNSKYGKKGKGSGAMSWGYRPGLSDEDTIKELDKWIKEMSDSWKESKSFHNHNTVAPGGMGKYYANNRRPDDEERMLPGGIAHLKSSTSYEMLDDNSVAPKIGTPGKEFNATIYNFINQIMNDPDADQNYFVAWFTYNSEGKDLLMLASDLHDWNYFFYIDEIEANAIKLGDPQKINYLYESIYTMSKAALNGDTKFSFKISNDLYLSFRTYVLDICMPYLSTEATETDPTKTMTVEGFTDHLDLHVAWHAGVGDDGKPQVAEIVFKSTDFVKMGSLTFDQAETSSSSSKIDGICRKILFRVFTSEPIEVVNPTEDWLQEIGDPGTPDGWNTNKDATKVESEQ